MGRGGIARKRQGTATAAGGGGVGEVRPGQPEVERGAGASGQRSGEGACGLSWNVDGIVPPGASDLAGAAVRGVSGRRTAGDGAFAGDGILADYAADQPKVLADLLMDADEKQFAVMYPKFKEHGERGLPELTGEIDKKLPPELPSSDEAGRIWRSGRRMRRWHC